MHTMTSTSSRNYPSARSVTTLEIQGETSSVQRWNGRQALLRREIQWGVDVLVRESIRQAPPQPIELEHAIELTENAVMPLADQFSGGNELVLHGMGAVLLAQGLEAALIHRTELTLDEVENLFNRLVAVSQGRPSTQEALPTDARFFAALLILREFMHHLQFVSVTLRPSGNQE